MIGPTLDLYLTGDLANIVASLELAGRNFGGEYGRGWSAALAALGIAIGTIPAPDARFTLQMASPPTAPSSWARTQVVSVEPAPQGRRATDVTCSWCGKRGYGEDCGDHSRCRLCGRRTRLGPAEDDYGPGAFAAFK